MRSCDSIQPVALFNSDFEGKILTRKDIFQGLPAKDFMNNYGEKELSIVYFALYSQNNNFCV